MRPRELETAMTAAGSPNFVVMVLTFSYPL